MTLFQSLFMSGLTVGTLCAQTEYTLSFENYLSGTAFDRVNSFNAGDWYDGLDG